MKSTQAEKGGGVFFQYIPFPLLLNLLPEPPNRSLALLLVHGQRGERLEGVVAVEEVDAPAVSGLEAPLGGLEHAAGRGAVASEAHGGRGAGALDGKLDVDVPPQLVHLAGYPRDLVLEVDLVAEDVARALVRPQGVQGRGYDGAG